MEGGDTIANADQAAAWDGEEGEGWARDWERYDRAVAAYRDRILAATAVTDGEHVLDVGCGNGQSTRDAAAATPSGSAVGIDLSSMMLERARQLTASAGLRNVEFVQGDAQVYPFTEAKFDVAVSRFGSMFFDNKVAAFTNIRRSLRAGGRLLLVVWQPMVLNEQFITMLQTLSAGRDLPTPPPEGPHPFSLADPERGRGYLGDSGFTDVNYEAANEDFYFGADADDAFAFACRSGVARGLLGGPDDATKTKALNALNDAMRAHETADGVLFKSATWFISARNP